MADTVTLLAAVSSDQTGPAIDAGAVRDDLTLEVVTAGTVSAFSVQLQASLDKGHWVNVGSPVTTVTAAASNGVLMRYFRAALSSYSGTGTVTAELSFAL